jgi:hypothetical protein
LSFPPDFCEEFYNFWFICFRATSEKIFAKAILKITLNEKVYPAMATVKKYVLTEQIDARNHLKQLEHESEPDENQIAKISEIVGKLTKKLKMKKLNRN